ncbi:MAG: ATP-dependent helicase HrpB [Alphaproteobacteria bacterium]|nr:ATP-dependent helicase HrpB [Alphaproteobacteria bacterium]HPF45780.1 ATP-dependent helicase HrpB [Emcibacteraceae bacterium]
MTINLPIYEIIPSLKKTCLANNRLVLQAPPGAGKTTVVPLELLDESWLGNKKIIMLEPRRLAARAAARRMAELLGETVGETVGYRVRMESRVGASTRIEVVTEGVLIRKIQSDPELSDTGIIIFDEFHERSLEADLGLALSLDIQEGLREDLKILVMSATIDGDRIAKMMADSPVLTSVGRSFGVSYRYLENKISGRIEEETTNVIIKALKEEKGSILVFLPGAGEIERTRKLLEEKQLDQNIMICPLYGMLPYEDQDRAINPVPEGKRKIVLSTDIAETSLTIEGIRIVIDAGQSRSAVFDIKSGMTGLETSIVSKASADQRAGRAGRLEEGVCYRLWTEAANRALKPYNDPEITKTDLVPLVLNLALWGVGDPAKLKWLDIPDSVSVEQARALLYSLGALDKNYLITDHGRRMAKFPMHPRLSHMIIKSADLGYGKLAITIAALLQERDILQLKPDFKTVDFRLRMEALEMVRSGDVKGARNLGCHISTAKKILKQINIWQKEFRLTGETLNIEKTGLCLATAFPDRIAARRQNMSESYILSGGRAALLHNEDPLRSEKFLSVANLDKGERDARIYIAAPILLEEIEEHFEYLISQEQIIEWDDQQEKVNAQNKIMLGKIPLKITNLENPNAEKIIASMVVGIRKLGLETLPWDKKSVLLKKRVELIRNEFDADFPNLSDEHLFSTLEHWLGPYLENITSRAAFKKIDLYEILRNSLSWQQIKLLDQLAPTHFKVPSGSEIAIDYSVNPPVLSVKLQEMFGALTSPSILDGKCALSVHLLSPARRPLQITSDLSGFWKNSYPEIKKEMKGRYPKHPWPDNPLNALPTGKIKPKK